MNHHKLAVRPDSLLGWEKIPGTSVRNKTSEYDILETINKEGQRGPLLSQNKEKKLKIMVVGDSFTEGYSVNEKDLFTTVIQEMLNSDGIADIVVFNAGTGGYSTDQELLWYRSEGVKYEADITILLFCSNDVPYNGLSDYYGTAKPYFQLTSDSTVLNLPKIEEQSALRKVKIWLGKNSELAKHLLQLKENLSPKNATLPHEYSVFKQEMSPQEVTSWTITVKLLEDFSADVEANGSAFLIVYVPPIFSVYPEIWEKVLEGNDMNGADFEIGLPATRLGKICDSLGIRFIEPTAELRSLAKDASSDLYFLRDRHWSAAGHAAMAEIINAEIRKTLNEISDQRPSSSATTKVLPPTKMKSSGAAADSAAL